MKYKLTWLDDAGIILASIQANEPNLIQVLELAKNLAYVDDFSFADQLLIELDDEQR